VEVEITPLPFALAERRPFAFAADLSQQALPQDGIKDTLAEFIKGDGLVSLEKHTSEPHSALIKKRDFGFVFALSIDNIRASQAEDVAFSCDLQHLAGVSQKSGHILNKRLAIPFALEEQGTQCVVWAHGGERVCRLSVFHLSGLSIRIVTDRAIS